MKKKGKLVFICIAILFLFSCQKKQYGKIFAEKNVLKIKETVTLELRWKSESRIQDFKKIYWTTVPYEVAKIQYLEKDSLTLPLKVSLEALKPGQVIVSVWGLDHSEELRLLSAAEILIKE